ncbi:MAG: efflux RND transporter periplasmic adaptor subunit [Armatimonadetes bacterium]|nr:efflux RND transporter periplasmic adaptor subunit [Armatimonadota bacterium]
MKKLKIFWGLILLILIAGITYFIVGHFRKPGQMTVLESQSMDMTLMTAPRGSIPVAAEIVELGNLEEKITYTGSVVPFNEQIVSPKVSGYLREIYVYPGDQVNQDQILAKIFSPELNSRLNEASFMLKSSQKEIKETEEELKILDAKREAGQAELDYWKAEISREEFLYKNGAVSKDEYQSELAKFKQAQANLKANFSEIKALEFKLSSRKNLTYAAQENQGAAKIFQEYTLLKAYLEGVVTDRLISQGSFVQAGAPILKISQINPIRVQANVAEKDFAGIKLGSKVKIIHPKLPEEIIESKVKAIFPAANPNSRTAVIETQISNSQKKFLPGEYVILEIFKIHKKNILTIPAKAIIELDSQERTAVWAIKKETAKEPIVYTCVMHPEVISDKPGNCPKCGMKLVPKETQSGKTAHLIYITLGITNGARTEVLSGLKEGDEVIYAGFDYLKEGDLVYPTSWSKSGPQELPLPPMLEGEHKKHSMPEAPLKEIHHHSAPIPEITKQQNQDKHQEQTKLYTCPMHPEVISSKPGNCPKCGMKLVLKK